MRLSSDILLLALAAAPAISSSIPSRSINWPGRFDLKLERRSRALARRGDGDAAVA